MSSTASSSAIWEKESLVIRSFPDRPDSGVGDSRIATDQSFRGVASLFFNSGVSDSRICG